MLVPTFESLLFDKERGGKRKTPHIRLRFSLSEHVSFAAYFHGFATPPLTQTEKTSSHVSHEDASLN